MRNILKTALAHSENPLPLNALFSTNVQSFPARVFAVCNIFDPNAD